MIDKPRPAARLNTIRDLLGCGAEAARIVLRDMELHSAWSDDDSATTFEDLAWQMFRFYRRDRIRANADPLWDLRISLPFETTEDHGLDHREDAYLES